MNNTRPESCGLATPELFARVINRLCDYYRQRHGEKSANQQSAHQARPLRFFCSCCLRVFRSEESMFFRERSTQAESFDSRDRSFREVAENYRHLARANRLFFFSHPFVWCVPRLVGRERCRELTFLDIGAGDGSLGRALTRWAARRGWNWRVTSLDASPMALELNPDDNAVLGAALNLPFKDGSFDVVIASQMTHHLVDDGEVARHFAEAWRVAKEAIVISDLHRNACLFTLVWLCVRLLRFPKPLARDGEISVLRGFRIPEWTKLAREAGIADARVWLYFGTRIMLEARKPVAG